MNGVIPVTKGQVAYEFQHLLNKLKLRDKEKYDEIKTRRRLMFILCSK